MISLPSNFPRRIRIRGGEFGASARAMHRKAALENVSKATIERKTMSTKTTFKRVALVAVAALGIGMLSAIPSNAAPTAVDGSLVYSAGTQIVGGQASIVITVDTGIVNTVSTSGVGTIVSAPSQTGTNPAVVSGTPTAGSFIITGGAGGATAATPYTGGAVTVTLTSSVVGTQTITIVPNNTNGTPGTAVTKTITWIAGATDAVVAASTAFIDPTLSGVLTVDNATAISVAATASQTSIGRIQVSQWSNSAKTIATAVASTQAVTVSLTGAGALQATSGGASSPSVTVAAGTAAVSNFFINANGVAGTGTITVSVNGVVISTKTVTFTGTFAAYKFGTVTGATTIIPVLGTQTTPITGLDSLGNTATVSSINVFSATPTVATAAVSGSNVVVTGVAVGTSVITVANNAVLASATITKTFTVTVGKATAKTVTISTDKTSYAAGEKIILTVKAVGSDGTATGDKALFLAFSSAGLTSNVALQGFPTSTGSGIALVGGVTTFTIYAPLSAGTVTINASEGGDTDNVGTNGTSAAAAITTSFDVTSPGVDAAVDAANAATDAANYAADAADAATTAAQEATAAAQAAQDSADAATAAVVALGLRVNVLMASVRAQLTSLSNLLVRIIKKTHA